MVSGFANPTPEEVAAARRRLQRGRTAQPDTTSRGFSRQPEAPTPAPQPKDRAKGGISGLITRAVTPLVDLPDQTNPVLRFGEEAIEGLTSPLGIASAVLAPVTGGFSLGLRGAAAAGAKVATRLGAEAVTGAVAGRAAGAASEALEDAPAPLRLLGSLGAGALAGGAAAGGFRALSKAAAPDVAQAIIQSQDAFTPEANAFIEAVGKAKTLLKDKDVMADLKRQRSEAISGRIGIGAAAEAALGSGAPTGARIGAFMKSLEGPQPRLDFPALDLQPEVIDAMRTQVWDATDRLSLLDRIGAIRGLETIFEAQGVPAPNELALLERVFGPAFTQAISSLKPYGIGQMVGDAISLPRALMASSDLSFPLNQGLFGLADPKAWAKSVKTAAHAFADPAFAKEHDLWVRGVTGTDFHKAAVAALQKADLNITGSAARPEELFQAGSKAMSTLFGGNEAGKILAASERGYVEAGNSLRVNLGEKTLAKLAEHFARSGDTPAQTVARIPHAEIKRITDTVNVLTGRSTLKAFQPGSKWSAPLNAFFFAPNFLASRLEAATLLPRSIYAKVATEGVGTLLDPVAMWKSDPVLGLQSKALGMFVAQGMGGLGLLKLASEAGIIPDLKIETDPRSSNFGKGKVGPTAIDFWGGYQQIARAVARLATGEQLTQNGDVRDIDRPEAIWDQFLRSKVAPVPGLGWDVITGSTYNGDRVQGVTEFDLHIRDRLLPLAVGDVVQGFHEGGWRSAAIGATSALGLRTTSFQSVAALKDSVAQEQFGKPYKDLTGPDQKVVDNHSHVLDKQREFDQVAGENFSVALDEVDFSRRQNENIIASRYLTQVDDIDTFVTNVEDQQRMAAVRREAARKQFGIEDVGANSPLQQALSGWFDLYDAADVGAVQGVKTGAIDWDKYDALERSYLNGLTPEQVAFIDARKRTEHDPSVQWYFNNKDYVSQSGYHDIVDGIFAKYLPRLGDDGIESYGDLVTAVNNARRADDRAAYNRLNNIENAINRQLKTARERARRSDVTLDAALAAIGRGEAVTPAAKAMLKG